MVESTIKTKSALLVIWAFILASLTFSLGAIPLNGLYRSMGRLFYWLFWLSLSGLIFVLGFKNMAAALVAISTSVGIFNEVRRHGQSYLFAGFIAVSFTSSTFFMGAYFWAKYKQIKWFPLFEKYINENVIALLPQSAQGTPPIDIHQIIMQIPSAGVILLVVSLFLALLFEKRVLLWLGLPVFQSERLTAFKLPEPTIWLFIGSLLMAFIKTEADWVGVVGMNLLNIVSLLYFFQGLAVMATYLEITKTSAFWRGLVYIFMIMQLFIIVVALGVLDYWFDFRTRISKKAAEIKNS